MLRLVLIHQLVLSLLAGPMLCCCTAARLGHEPKSHSSQTEKSERKSCCRESQSPDSRQPVHDSKPAERKKCSCKVASQTDAVMPETTAAIVDPQTTIVPGGLHPDFPYLLCAVPASVHLSALLDRSSSVLSADDLLYSHHNLRC